MAEILRLLSNKAADAKKYTSIICPWIQVDDNGIPFAVFQQRRIFRNFPDIRYVGRIHEALSTTDESTLYVTEIGIIHTGYSRTAYKDTNKAQRNIELLEKELAECPNNANLKCYLADSLSAEKSQENVNRSLILYAEAIEASNDLTAPLKHSAFIHLVHNYYEKGDSKKAIELCRRAIVDFPEIPDFYAYLGLELFKIQEYVLAWDALRKCEETLNTPISSDFIRTGLITKPIILFANMAQIAQKMDDKKSVVHYSILTLKEDKYLKEVLAALLQTLSSDGNTTDEDILSLLRKLYDFGNNKDKALVLVSAKLAGNRPVFNMTRESFTEEEIKQMRIPTFDECG